MKFSSAILSSSCEHRRSAAPQTDKSDSCLLKRQNDVQNTPTRLLLILILSGSSRGQNICAASPCVSLCMFSTCKSPPRSLWRILLNYTAADKSTLSICRFKKLQKHKKMDWREEEGGFGAELTLKSSWKIRLIHSADLASQREERGGRIQADLKPRSSSSCSSLRTERFSVTAMSRPA